jgi:tetratricopeptide (TPR) repeat protein
MSSAAALPDFDLLWSYDKPAETEAQFRALLPAAEQSGDTVYLAELQTQIARTLSLQQKFAEAHTLLDEVEAKTARAVDSPTWERVHVRYLLERGRTFNSANEKEKALPLFVEAWDRARAAGLDGFAVDAAHMAAIAAPSPEVMTWNQKALALAENSADPKARRWRASLYNNIGWDYFGRGDYDAALVVFEKAVDARIEQKQPVEARFARWCVAKTRRLLGQADTAFALQQQLERETAASGDSPDGFIYEELAECLLAMGREDEARPHFARAYELLQTDPWLARDEPARLQWMKTLGRVP